MVIWKASFETPPSAAPQDEACSCELGVAGIVDEANRIDSELAQSAQIFAVHFGIEDQLGIGRAIEPAIGVDLAFELARRPPGIAERKQRLVGAGALGDVAQDVDGGGKADALVDG